MLYFKKTPGWLKAVFSRAVWDIKTTHKDIYLTFDDGPIPALTPWVLSVLADFNARATFFYVGDNIRKYPELVEQAVDGGHSIGNHTYNHLKGWKTDTATYLENVERCERLIEAYSGGKSRRLFRPPYGQLSLSQAKTISSSYKVVMWDYLTGDFDASLSPHDCHQGAVGKSGPGSIVIYHENVKAEPSIRYSLPLFLDHFTKEGFKFCAIE